ncbi:MAG: hypothetical protein DI591_00870 [Citromicrobium sp.]|nr:MAG: hypothetical protein DI591_00870 [Citromicrobium sp.]
MNAAEKLELVPELEAARALFVKLDQIHLVAINPADRDAWPLGRDFGTDIEAATRWAAQVNADGRNVYWTVNAVRPGLDKKPAEKDMTAARFVHVDIDPPKDGSDWPRDEVLAALRTHRPKPSFVFDSGNGLQAFWRLGELVENWQQAKEVNDQLRHHFGGDACHNIDRLMRVPGFVNYPDAKKAKAGRVPQLAQWVDDDDGVVYELEQLRTSLPPVPAKAKTAECKAAKDSGAIGSAIPVPLLTADDLDLPALSPIRMSIEYPPGEDRSGDGLAAAGDMARAGYTDEQIFGILLNPANPVSAHFREQRNPSRAVARAIEQVRGSSAGTEPPRPMPKRVEFDWRAGLGSGALSAFVDYAERTAPSPQGFIALGAALSAFGAIAGRRYRSPSDLRTNLYAIGICDSGGGKDHALDCIQDLFRQAGLQSKLGGSRIASGQAMITDLMQAQNLLYPLDELGFMIRSINGRGASSHERLIMDFLTEFYSAAKRCFRGTSYADQREKPRQVIEQPCLNLFGVTTPQVFWGSLSSGNVTDGSLARMLIFESQDHFPDPNFDIARVDMPSGLVEIAKAINDGADDHITFPIGEGPQQVPAPYTVPYANETAARRFNELRLEQTDLLRRNAGSNRTSALARLAENAGKIALIKAITDNPASPAITTADLEWARGVVGISVDRLLRAIQDSVSDNPEEAKLKAMLQVIRKAGSAGITHTVLGQEFQQYGGNRKAFNDAIETLKESGRIVERSLPRADGKPGRLARTFFAIET